MFYKINDELNYTIIYDEKIERIFVEHPTEIEVGSILHARVKRVDKNRSFAFIEMGGIDGFYNGSDLKAGSDYLFNIRKKPDSEKGYVLDRNLKVEIENNTMYPFSEKYFDNEMEKIVGCPVKSKKFNESVALELKEIYENLKREKSQLPIPKIVYQKKNKSEEYIKNHDEKLGDAKSLLQAFTNTPELKGRTIECEEGGLIVDVLPHITFVDFNSTDFSKIYTKELNHNELNQKLISEAVRVLDLRNIEGMIIIDVLKMEDYEDLIKHAKKCFKNTGFIYHDITKLGLMEITRKKIGRTTITEDLVNKIINYLVNLDAN